MRVTQANLILVLCFATLSVLCGCGADNTQPEGPELGSVQAYLDEHPEVLTDEDGEVSEEEEFAAAEAE